MTSGEPDDLRHLFITKAVSRLKYTLRRHPELATQIELRVRALAAHARFELVGDNRVPREAEKSLRKFIEIIVVRFRQKRVSTQAEFDRVWQTVPSSAKEFCRKWFKKFDPNVYC